jgi:predicted metal-binding membrane protein
MWRAARVASSFPPLALALVSLAWASLTLWDLSPYHRYLHHADWSTPAAIAAVCAALPAGSWVVPAVLYSSGWVLMIAAMMLPTTLPLIRMFARIIAARAERNSLHALLIIGYLATWGAFGLLAYVMDHLLHIGFDQWTWLAAHPWTLGAVVLAVAGGFQFSPLKYHCLDRCRAPLGS